eukprot:scaffold132937_cov55-Attheya_sp.AAC.1
MLGFSFRVASHVNVCGWIGWRWLLPLICSRLRENAGELLGAGGWPTTWCMEALGSAWARVGGLLDCGRDG